MLASALKLEMVACRATSLWLPSMRALRSPAPPSRVSPSKQRSMMSSMRTKRLNTSVLVKISDQQTGRRVRALQSRLLRPVTKHSM